MPSSRIMPLGDSITVGYGPIPLGDPVGYRQRLHERLMGSGRVVDFVGSQQAGAMADRQHEGHAGYTTDMLLAGLPGWLDAARPDVVLLLAGTNDLSRAVAAGNPNGDIDSAARRLVQITDMIEGRGIWVLVAPIPPFLTAQGNFTAQADQYNAMIRVAVEQRQSAGMRVRWVPVSWHAGLLADGVHPNADGYRVLADAWFDALTMCGPRAPVQIPTTSGRAMQITREQTGPMTYRVSAVSSAPISGVAFGPVLNATVSGLAIGGKSATFMVTRSNPGAWQVPFTVNDSCGPWRTLVGGGA